MAPGRQNQMPGCCGCRALRAARMRVLVFTVPPRAAHMIYYLLSIISYFFLSPLMSLFCAAKTYIKNKRFRAQTGRNG